MQIPQKSNKRLRIIRSKVVYYL